MNSFVINYNGTAVENTATKAIKKATRELMEVGTKIIFVKLAT